jgi:hydroxypyruvate reductase/glycerate 2-kinase
MTNREIVQKIFIEGVRSVLPEKLIRNIIRIKGPELRIKDLTFNLNDIANIYVIGAGKASAAMAHYTEVILGERITDGHIIVKYDYACQLEKIKVTEAGHPIPDQNSFKATEEILKIADNAGDKDLVICLLSGGGSSLMTDLPPGLLPEEIIIVNNLMVRCGASISEINCVRKHLSLVKGGHLARRAWPATLVTLIISDVPDDSVDVIASGPTAPDPSTFSDALNLIAKYGLAQDLTTGVLKYLQEGAEGIRTETPKPGDKIFSRTFNIITGTNLVALEGAGKVAIDLGLNTFIIDSGLKGDVESVSQSVLEASIRYKEARDIRKPVCLLYGGETTVRVAGNGLGGRNQHLALLMAIRLKDYKGITFLAAGTDGTDGFTSAAGAVADSETIEAAASRNADPEKYLQEFDSYNFFRIAGGLIKTGPTYTNVMDLLIVIIE